ncbi:MAG: hypothetical protein K2J08_00105 [Ruminococcus sp.]|nr:hypothetical protein [Ruminococcus sp.]
MDCPVCRTNNASGIKYCVRCGRELENSREVNYNNNMISADFFSDADEIDLNKTEDTTVADIFMEEFSEENGLDFDMGSFSAGNGNKKDTADFLEEDKTINSTLEYESDDNKGNNVSRSEQIVSQPYANASPYVSQIYGSRVYSSQSVNSLPSPQIIGYYPDGTAIYGLPPVFSQPISQPVSQPVSQPLKSVQTVQTDIGSRENEKFRQFIDDGKAKENLEKQADDFFSTSADKKDALTARLDVIDAKKREAQKKKKDYMSDAPSVESRNIVPNNASKFNKMYMRGTATVDASNLEEKKYGGNNDIMSTTRNVNANRLNAKMKFRSRIRMNDAENSQTDTFNTQEKKKKRKYLMAETEHAVEAMPKKKKYVDELDKIELPEYMKMRKKVKKDKPEIPEL